MPENFDTFSSDFIRQAEALAGSPIIPATLAALFSVGLFLALIWLKKQPQASFFHLALCQISYLLLLYFYAPSERIETTSFLVIALHAALFAWLIFAPLDYGRATNEQRFKDVFRKRILWLFVSIMLVGGGGLADFFYHQESISVGLESPSNIDGDGFASTQNPAAGLLDNLPFELHFLVWGFSFATIFAIAAIAITPKFKKAFDEGLAFAFVVFSFVGVSYLHNFTSSPLALLSALPGAGFLIIFTLLYHNRFVHNETELREGLLEQNQALHEKQQTHENILSHMREAVLHLDRDEKILFANAAFENLTGLDRIDIQGKNFRAVVGKTFYDALARALNDAKSGRESVFEIMLHRPNVGDVGLNVRAKPLLDHRQKVEGAHFGFLDLTEQIERQGNLSANIDQQEKDLQLFRTALNKIEDGMVITEADCRIVFVNGAFCRITGHRTADLVGRSTSVYRLETKMEREAIKVLQQGKVWQGAFKNRSRDGNEFVVDVYAAPISLRGESPLHYLWVERDASERLNNAKTRERFRAKIADRKSALEETLEEQISILGALQTGIIFVSPQGECRFLNDDASTILGFSSSNISLKNLPVFVSDLLRLESNHSGKLHSEAHEFVDDFLRPDGVKKHLRWRATPATRRDGEFIGVVLQAFDLTAQKHEAEKLKTLERQAVSGKTQGASVQSESDSLQKIINLAETVHSNISFNEKIQTILRTSAAVGWPRLIVYEKPPEQNAYFSLDARGFSSEIKTRTLRVEAEDIEQYFQTRYAIGDAFFLQKAKNGAARLWDFWPGKQLKPTAKGDWSAHDFLIFPLQQNDEQIGLLLFGAPAHGQIPVKTSIEILEKLATQAAHAIQQKRFKQQIKTTRERDDLLAMVSRMERLDVTPDREIKSFLNRGKRVLQCEIGIIVYGEPPVGASTCADKAKREKADMLNQAQIEKILACEKSIIPSGGAKIVSLHSAESPFVTALGLPPIRKNPVEVVVARLVLNRKKYGFIYCWSADKSSYTKEFCSYFTEIAARISFVLENTRIFSETESKAHELEKANRHISEFLSNVSHELRTPLNVILRYVELLRERKGVAENDRLRYLQTIRISGDNLLGLINDLLDMSKIEAGKFEPSPEAFSPREIIQATEDAIRPLCEKSGLKLRVAVDASIPPYIVTDRSMLSRALLNLARNAQKFTPSGVVEITAKFVGNKVLKLQVADTGVGIPKDKFDEIFEPFQQADRTASRQFEGTGLGLPISRKMVELLGGKLNLKSRVGVGTTFTIELPVKALKRKPRAKGTKSAVTPKPKARKKKAHILLVDDNRSTEEAMRFFIENEGFKVDFAYDGPSAVSMAHKLRPDLIFLDIMMPGMDGYEVVRTLKAQKQLKEIPVIALTAHAMAEERRKAKAAGYDDFLSKPFEMKAFWQMTATHLK